MQIFTVQINLFVDWTNIYVRSIELITFFYNSLRYQSRPETFFLRVIRRVKIRKTKTKKNVPKLSSFFSKYAVEADILFIQKLLEMPLHMKRRNISNRKSHISRWMGRHWRRRKWHLHNSKTTAKHAKYLYINTCWWKKM